jgi:hypothetical protein
MQYGPHIQFTSLFPIQSEDHADKLALIAAAGDRLIRGSRSTGIRGSMPGLPSERGSRPVSLSGSRTKDQHKQKEKGAYGL